MITILAIYNASYLDCIHLATKKAFHVVDI